MILLAIVDGVKKMNVVYSANDNYARHLAVSMYSLLDHNQQAEQIQIYILSSGIEEESQARLRSIAAKFERDLVIVDMGDLRRRFPYQVDTGGFDISAMGRLFLGTFLPEHITRVLYLDCDTVVVDSIEKLWQTQLDGNLLAAVMEPTIYPVVKQRLGLTSQDPYFNSGVLLIDVQAWRQENVEQKLLDFYGALGGKTFACDQDTLNGALRGRIKALDPRYNFFTNFRYFHYGDLLGQSPSYCAVSKDMFLRAKRNPAVLHFAGDERPWKSGNFNHYRKNYEHYLELTPWRGTPKENGKRTYLFLYHLMDYMTWLCPPARRMVSRKFGMQMIEGRQNTK